MNMDATKIPAIRGHIGDTVYYITNLSFGQIKEMVKKVDNELHDATSIKEQIQRSLTSNYTKIRDYILSRDDFFFDSLVLAVYDGEPQWIEVRYEIDDECYYNVGLLVFSGEEKIFPIDGQHRVEGIKAAVSQRPSLSSNTISAIFIGHDNTVNGRERSRRIFSTLNRYVKPVRLGDIIALDEDDIVAIVTRNLLESYPLFINDRIKLTNSKSIPVSDKFAFTSLMTLYSCHLSLFATYISLKNQRKYKQTQIRDYLKVRPSDIEISEFWDYLVGFWNCMRHCFREIENYVNNNSDDAASELRSTVTGGNLFFRPVGLLPFVEAISRISLEKQISYSEIIPCFSGINRTVSEFPWNKVLWNPMSHRMVMRNQSVVKSLLIYMYDNTLLTSRERENLYTKYAAIFGFDTEAEAVDQINTIIL